MRKPWLLTDTLNGVVTQYTYDNNGNTLSEVTSPTDQTVYHWDSQNRLIEADVTTASGTTQTVYQYDVDGIRVSQTTAGQETRYLIDTVQPYAQVLLEYRPSELIVASYVYGKALISQNRGGVLSYYLVDALGSTRALTNANGVVTDRYVYDAFGRMISQTGNTVNSYLFAGQQRDAATGLDYLRARYMNPATGRFVSRDTFNPIFFKPSTLNLYAYADSNPVNRIDPSGYQSSLLEVLTSISTESILLRSVTLGAAFGGGTQLFNKFVLGKNVTFGDVLTGTIVGGIVGAFQGFFVARYAREVGEAVYVDAITEGLEDSAVDALVFEMVKRALLQAAAGGVATKTIIGLINPNKIVNAITGP